ncbi:MAG: hypothetical protein IIB35_11425 [Gemmatimonadetes bacterium]|nr:hypothetical protein [Gemmatimonadota bacterium]
MIFGREVFDELLEASDSDGARAVVRAERDRVVRVPVSDSAVVEDLNTPSEYERLKQREDEKST